MEAEFGVSTATRPTGPGGTPFPADRNEAHSTSLSQASSSIRLSRRSVLAGTLGTIAITRGAAAQNFPIRPLRLLVGFAPGGGATIISRLVADWLGHRLGQSVLVENRPGASGNLAVQEVIKAAPDGHTLLLYPASAIVNRAFATQLFDVLRDLTPVCGLIEFPLVMVVPSALPVTSTLEFISYAAARPGELNLASFGIATSSHVAGELFQMMTGTKMLHVPYPGEAVALFDLIASRVHVMFSALTGCLEHIKAGSIRAIAVAGKVRDEALPDIPTVAEAVPGYEANSWLGLAVPSGTPPGIVETLEREVREAFRSEELLRRLKELGARPLPLSRQEFRGFTMSEARKWEKLASLLRGHK
jgi:tripartite-type tricarboxylate transporter receptor subunit TctC